MKLQIEEQEVVSSQEFTDIAFSIGDLALVHDILRNKMYSNPLRAMVQEVISNARDAHREVGKNTVPICITLPTKLDPQFYVSDEGPGISPQRMEKVFVKYGKSTKRESDDFTGGWGLGCKTPFAISDNFSVIVYQDGIKRTYQAYIDASRVGALSLISEEKNTDHANGTTIAVYIDEDRWRDLRSYLHDITLWWDVRPKITNDPQWSWREPEVVHQGVGWQLVQGSNKPQVIVDGIPYDLRVNNIYPKWEQPASARIFDRAFRLFFAVNEIPVTPTREDISYLPQTCQQLQDRAEEIYQFFAVDAQQRIDQCANLWEASITWQEEKDKYNKVINLQPRWHGKQLISNDVTIDWSHRSEVKIQVYTLDQNKPVLVKRYSSHINSFGPYRGILVLEHDLDAEARHDRLRLITAWQQHPDFDNIALIVPNKEQPDLAAKGLVYLESAYNYSELGWGKLSSYAKASHGPRAIGVRGKVIPIKRLSEYKTGVREYIRFGWTPAKNCDLDAGGVYVILKGSNAQWLGRDTNNRDIERLQQALGETIWGLQQQSVKRLLREATGEWITAEQAARDKLLEWTIEPDYLAYLELGGDFGTGGFFHWIDTQKTKLLDPFFAQYLSDHQQAERGQIIFKKVQLVQLQLKLPTKVPGDKLSTSRTALINRYPFLEHYNNYFYSDELLLYCNHKYEAQQP